MGGGFCVTSKDVMEALSQCGLGALLADGHDRIADINSAGRTLLRGRGEIGASLRDVAPAFCEDSASPSYLNVSFGEYVQRCPAPEVTDLPPDLRLIAFRDARNDVCHDMLLQVVNQVSDSVILCDEEGRVFFLNDAAVRMDSLLMQEVAGKNLHDVYTVLNEKELEIPQVMKSCQPRLNVRQHYVTWHGKNVDIVDDTYPVVLNRKVLGGFSIMRDWTQVDQLHRQVLELQGALLEQKSPGAGAGRKNPLSARYHFEDLIYCSAVMDCVIARGRMCAKSDSSVMICGETGTGKELFAQSIHNASRRSAGPFLAINCAAIPENLLESLLFGTEKGVYTGAERRAGLFEQANGGTLLLDEINSMPLALQSKLLRVLQDGLVRRVGGSTEIHVNVRILSNINIPPQQAVREQKLRSDLLYRLGAVNLTIPPLRERTGDVPLLTKHFILEFNKKLLKNVQGMDPDVAQIFLSYGWPGNVRELQHAIEHAMNLLPDTAASISRDTLPDYILAGSAETETPAAPPAPAAEKTPDPAPYRKIHDIERDMLIEKLRENKGNISRTARALEISRQNLQYRIKRNHIDLGEL